VRKIFVITREESYDDGLEHSVIIGAATTKEVARDIIVAAQDEMVTEMDAKIILKPIVGIDYAERWAGYHKLQCGVDPDHLVLIHDGDRTCCYLAEEYSLEEPPEVKTDSRRCQDPDILDRWTHDDNVNALADGWGIFTCTRGYQIQKFDRMGRFGTDLAAWYHVTLQSKAGNGLAAKALLFLKTHAPKEYEIVLSCVEHEKLPEDQCQDSK